MFFVLLNKNQFRMTEVKTGNSENGYIEILNPECLQDKKVITKDA